MKNKLITIFILFTLNVASFIVAQSFRTEWDGTVLHEEKERLRIATQIGSELITQTSISHGQRDEFGAQVRKGKDYLWSIKESRNGYVATSKSAEKSYSIKVKVYSIDDYCSLLILPTVKIDNIWLTCFLE